MNYEQKYKEALERARSLHKDACINSNSSRAKHCELIFPELKESEDGQIRKELLEHCINRRDGKQVCVDANDYRRWADWLEKQGQSKKTSIWKHWKDGIAGNGNNIPVFLIKNGLTYSLSSCLSFECDYIELSELDSLMLEKQGEQKQDPCNHCKDKCLNCHNFPCIDKRTFEQQQEQTIEIPFGAKDSELQEVTYHIPDGYNAEINGNEVIIKKGEQKYSWSEEDEKKRTLLIRILEVNHPNSSFKVNPANTLNMEVMHTEELVSWLKSLKSRIKGE